MKTNKDEGLTGTDGKWRAGKLTIIDSEYQTSAFLVLVKMVVLVKRGYTLRIK